MALETIRLAELVEDTSLWPRHNIDDGHVAALVRALCAGAELPPIVADKKSKRIVDGWHRLRAHLEKSGPEAMAPVDLCVYKNDEAMLLDAIRLNSAHGRRLNRRDEVRCVVLAEERGISTEDVATALNVTEERVTRLKVRLAYAPVAMQGTVPGTLKVALKTPVRHLEGLTLTEEQVRAIGSAPGTSYLLLIRQLHDALTQELIDLEDERVMEALRQLSEDLGQLLEAA